MALSLEANFELKDRLIRSAFRLVDVEIRVDGSVLRSRVSNLLKSRLAVAESQDVIRFDPGSVPLLFPPTAPTPGVTPPDEEEEEPVKPAPLAARAVVGRQVYTIRGSNSPNNITLGANLIADGILTRARGSTVAPFDFLDFDNGIRLLISDSEDIGRNVRVGGDFDLFQVGSGGNVTGTHGIGVGRENAVGESAGIDQFDVPFHRLVRAGQRFGVDLNAGGIVGYWVTFEVTQFAEFEGGVSVLRERIIDSAPASPAPRGFDPVMMVLPGREEVLPKVVTSLAEFKKWFENSWVPKGRITSSSLSLL
ncbi:hypothetical protein LCGC14_0989500 [marine sediment metagenome]|uniref:Uncharacterized protein n=1 Tax=marine sediment metagenome TaxID=412755 RepID=A0A0F9QPM1_9ZZZZ